jgi:hypothetical protein
MNKNILPPTTQKAALNTCDLVNGEIRTGTVCCIDKYKDSSEAVLSDKICRLDYEWDTERVLEAKTAICVLLSSIIGCGKKRSCMFFMTGALGFFLLQHALLGWCPSLPIIRKMGVRTAEEINNEKTVLKFLRGDFSHETNDADDLLRMTENKRKSSDSL